MNSDKKEGIFQILFFLTILFAVLSIVSLTSGILLTTIFGSIFIGLLILNLIVMRPKNES